MTKKFYEIQLDKCLVVLTKDEINTLLQGNKAVFKAGLKRGKGFIRARRQRQRERAKLEQEGDG